MNRMKFLSKIIYAVGISLSMALTLSCSDDKDGKNDYYEYCLCVTDSYAYCAKPDNGVCSCMGISRPQFSDICPSGYDSSPKACALASGQCLGIVPRTYTEASCKYRHEGYYNSEIIIVDYNTFCFK